jgi:hypothetical protein
MSKIVRLFIFFSLSGIFWDCKKNDPQPDNTDPFEEWKLYGETIGRPGPGFSWRLSTDKQADGHFDLAGDRLFYLDSSGDYIREVTLTITKLDEAPVDPTFRIYGRFQQCLLMTVPTVSSGTFKASGIFQRDGIISNSQYSGMSWSPDMAKSPVNSKAIYKFKVYMNKKDSLCTEGFVQVDMVAPAAINSTASYSDGDHLYFVKRNK